MNIENGKYVAGKLENVKITKAGSFKNDSGDSVNYDNSIKLIISYNYNKEIEIGGQKLDQEQKIEEIAKMIIKNEQEIPNLFKQFQNFKNKRILTPINITNFDQIQELK
jgi:hypothetical protein